VIRLIKIIDRRLNARLIDIKLNAGYWKNPYIQSISFQNKL